MFRKAWTTAGLALLLVACQASPAQPSSPSATSTGASAPVVASPTPYFAPTRPPAPVGLDAMTPGLWEEDLDALDAFVREMHAEPFVRTTEPQWAAEVERVRRGLPGLTSEQSVLALMRLMGLLDSHSGLSEWDAGYRTYPLLPYAFSDGVYILKAWDPELVGARVDGIGSGSIDEVLASLEGVNGADNSTAVLGTLHRYLFLPELLVANGFIADRAAAGIKLTLADGTTRIVHPPDPLLESIDLDVIDGLEGGAPEAVARRREPIWWRVDELASTFVLAYNAAGEDATQALAAFDAARAAGDVDRMVVDLRFDPGGAYYPSLDRLLRPIAADQELNQPDQLAVLIGREGFSAAGALASAFDSMTEAVLFGEPTPTRANPFLDATSIPLPRSGIPIYVPTTLIQVAAGDEREAVEPDVPVGLSAVEFFDGEDPVLDAALKPR